MSFPNGALKVTPIMLRDLVNSTVGFGQLAELTHKSSKSLHRMRSPKGNPSMDSLSAICGAVRSRLRVGINVGINVGHYWHKAADGRGKLARDKA